MKKILFTAAIILSIFSCSDKKEFISNISLPGMTGERTAKDWAVINNDVVRLREAPDFKAAGKGIIYKGAVVEISEKTEDWLFFSAGKIKGWISNSTVSFFNNRNDAIQYSKNVLGTAFFSE